jgi:hypothetical protein
MQRAVYTESFVYRKLCIQRAIYTESYVHREQCICIESIVRGMNIERTVNIESNVSR